MKYWFAAAVLCVLATVRVFADLFDLEEVNAVFAVTNAAPAMKVFTAHNGYETYSSIFEIIVDYEDGQSSSLRLNPGNYSGLRGPYNRRNVYGALIAYGPVLVSNVRTREMWGVMASRAFCGQSAVLREIGFEHNARTSRASISYLNQVVADGAYPTSLDVSCDTNEQS